jgi:hypothetical protein
LLGKYPFIFLQIYDTWHEAGNLATRRTTSHASLRAAEAETIADAYACTFFLPLPYTDLEPTRRFRNTCIDGMVEVFDDYGISNLHHRVGENQIFIDRLDVEWKGC